jgi:roadblock/LC7 domain-containing protein
MGFFKSVRELNKQGKEISRNWDVGAQLADAQASMTAANQMMAQQTAAANIAATGLDATATVAAVRQSGAHVNYQPMVEIDLTVMAPGSPPYPATISQVVQQVHLAFLQPGSTLRVKVDPANPATIWIDFLATA